LQLLNGRSVPGLLGGLDGGDQKTLLIRVRERDMTPAHLSKVFAACGLILLGLTANAYLATQGEKALLNIPLLHEDRAANAFLTLFVASGLLIATSCVGWLHAIRTGDKWYERVPTVWLEGLATASWDGRLYQIVVVALFVGIPIVAMVHLIDVLRIGQLCTLDTNTHVPVSVGWLHGIPNSGDQQIRLLATFPADGRCTGGIQVFPRWEFLLLGILFLVSFACAVIFLLRVAGIRRRP
jgi:hypothetical protein